MLNTSFIPTPVSDVDREGYCMFFGFVCFSLLIT